MANWNASRAALLSGHVFHRFVLARWFRRGGCAALQRKDHLANFDLLPLFDLDLAHYAADRGRNFDDGFVGLEFHHRLAFRNARSRREIIKRTRSPESMFSPSSGSLNSLAVRGGCRLESSRCRGLRRRYGGRLRTGS